MKLSHKIEQHLGFVVHSADRKRQIRLLMNLQAVHDSVIKTVATSLGMRTFGDLSNMHADEGDVGFASSESLTCKVHL